MKIALYRPTYQYNTPILFCGVEYYDSKSFVEAILDNWDEAITAYMCGDWADLWKNHTNLDDSKCSEIQNQFNEPYEEIWRNIGKKNVDVLFTKALHYIEPAMSEIPCFISNQNQLELWGKTKYRFYYAKWGMRGGYMRELLSNNLVVDPNRQFDETKEGILYAAHMSEEKVFKTYGFGDVDLALCIDIRYY